MFFYNCACHCKWQEQRTYKNTLLASLREGDLISQYNKWQYVIMLTQCDYNNALVVVRRIKGNLRVKKLDESIEYAIERIQ